MREFKGNLIDQWVDFKFWAKNEVSLVKLLGADPVKMTKAFFRYPWLYDAAKANAFARTLTEGRNGTALWVTHKAISDAAGDFANSVKTIVLEPDRSVLIADVTPVEIMHAMGLNGYYTLLTPFATAMFSQHGMEKYIDNIQSMGLAADSCSLPAANAGMTVADMIPPAACMLASNLPCDAGAASYDLMEKKLDVPTFYFDIPDDYKQEGTEELFAEQLKEAIKFLEKHTGHKMDWDRLKQILENFNVIQEHQLEREEYMRLDQPTIHGDMIWIPHLWAYTMAGGTELMREFYEQSGQKLQAAYEKKEPAFNNIKYKAVMWGPPPQIYLDVFHWMERCWGIAVTGDLESYGDNSFYDTSSPDAMLKSLAHRQMRAIMSRHTRGPAENFIDDCFKACEQFNPDFIMFPNQIGCRGAYSLGGIMKEECNKRGYKLCWWDYSLMDPRIISRQEVRDQINKFMFNVMKAEPIDPTLVEFDDENAW